MRTRIELKMFTSKAKFSLTIALSFMASMPLSWSQTQYSIADLEVLKSGKSYEEFFKHAHDIIPSQRNEYWREMLTTMATDFVDEKRSYKQYDSKTYKKIDELGNWSELKRDEFFQIKRNSYSLSYFRNCFTKKSKDSCRTQMEKFWKTANQDLETSYQMAALHYGLFPGVSGYKYLGQILQQAQDQFYCSKPIVKSIFISYLAHETLHQKGHAQRKIFMDGLISKSCWDKMVPTMKENLDDISPERGRSLFFALHLNKVLSDVEYHEWMVRFFLRSPLPGELLNLSWNSLKSLAQDYSLRERVLKKLKQRDPLPGALFERLESSRSQALAFHLQESFPEYINTYAKTCLNYLEGKGNYPFGNPTPECHKFFRSTADASKKVRDLLTPSWRARYSALVPTNRNYTAGIR